jgi:hypothetical protein
VQPGGPAAGAARFRADRARSGPGGSLRRDPPPTAGARWGALPAPRLRVELARTGARNHGSHARGTWARTGTIAPTRGWRSSHSGAGRASPISSCWHTSATRLRRASGTSGTFVPPGAKAMPICWCACAPGMRRCGTTAWSSRTAALHARSWPCAASRSGRRLRPSPGRHLRVRRRRRCAIRVTGDGREKRRRANPGTSSFSKRRPDVHVRPPESASAVANARQAAMR